MIIPKHFLALTLAGYSLAVDQQAPTNGTSAQLPAPSQYVLGPEDQVKIWALGMEEISDKPARIDPSGDLDLPLIGKVHAGGVTVEQLKAELVQRPPHGPCRSKAGR